MEIRKKKGEKKEKKERKGESDGFSSATYG